MLDRFHLTLDQIAKLTDRQIHDLYFHPRDDEGNIRPKSTRIKREPQCLEDELAVLDQIRATMQGFGGLANYDEMVQKIKEKWTK